MKSCEISPIKLISNGKVEYWLIADGETFPKKEILKDLGFEWAATTKEWRKPLSSAPSEQAEMGKKILSSGIAFSPAILIRRESLDNK